MSLNTSTSLWDKWNEVTFTNKIEICLGIAIAAFTALMMVFGYWQANVSSDAVKVATDALRFQKYSDSLNRIEQQIANDSTIAFAQRSLFLSKDIADRQERFTKMQLRAYIHFGAEEPIIKVGHIPRANMGFVNTGNTPAYHLRHKSKWIFAPEVTKANIDSLNASPYKVISGITVGAKQTNTVRSVVRRGVFTREDSILIFSGAVRAFLYGVIAYDDKFGERHLTQYCVFYDIKDNTFAFYDRWNDAD